MEAIASDLIDDSNYNETYNSHCRAEPICDARQAWAVKCIDTSPAATNMHQDAQLRMPRVCVMNRQMRSMGEILYSQQGPTFDPRIAMQKKSLSASCVKTRSAPSRWPPACIRARVNSGACAPVAATAAATSSGQLWLGVRGRMGAECVGRTARRAGECEASIAMVSVFPQCQALVDIFATVEYCKLLKIAIRYMASFRCA